LNLQTTKITTLSPSAPLMLSRLRSWPGCAGSPHRTSPLTRPVIDQPGLLIRRFLCGHPDPFRSVRDLGLVPARCSGESGISESRSPRWLPAWLPVSEGPPDRLACRGPSAFQTGHIPSCWIACWRPCLPPIGDACRWLLLLLSPLLSTAVERTDVSVTARTGAGDGPRPVRAGSGLALVF
jgi:hypothetical protein